MLNTKKIIIFLTPITNSISRKRRQSLLANYCQQNNFTILKIVEYKDSINCSTLRELINEIMAEPVGSITALVEDQLLNNPSSIILLSMLGTLALTGLIKPALYKKSSHEIKLYESVFTQNDFLSIATFSLNYILDNTKQEIK